MNPFGTAYNIRKRNQKPTDYSEVPLKESPKAEEDGMKYIDEDPHRPVMMKDGGMVTDEDMKRVDEAFPENPLDAKKERMKKIMQKDSTYPAPSKDPNDPDYYFAEGGMVPMVLAPEQLAQKIKLKRMQAMADNESAAVNQDTADMGEMNPDDAKKARIRRALTR